MIPTPLHKKTHTFDEPIKATVQSTSLQVCEYSDFSPISDFFHNL